MCRGIFSKDNNNNDFFCAYILDKTKGLRKLVNVKQCVSRQWMDEEARRLRRIGSIKETGFTRRKLGGQFSFSPEECKLGYYWLSVAVWNILLELASNLDTQYVVDTFYTTTRTVLDLGMFYNDRQNSP